jgi:hypothetical protein
MQRQKEELQDIARAVTSVAPFASTNDESLVISDIAARIRSSGTLITHLEREEDAKRMALEAYEDFTMLIKEGCFNLPGTD